jgi:hypothetical protein
MADNPGVNFPAESLVAGAAVFMGRADDACEAPGSRMKGAVRQALLSSGQTGHWLCINQWTCLPVQLLAGL